MGRHILDLAGVAGYCECANEHLDCVRCGEFPEWLRNCGFKGKIVLHVVTEWVSGWVGEGVGG